MHYTAYVMKPVNLECCPLWFVWEHVGRVRVSVPSGHVRCLLAAFLRDLALVTPSDFNGDVNEFLVLAEQLPVSLMALVARDNRDDRGELARADLPDVKIVMSESPSLSTARRISSGKSELRRAVQQDATVSRTRPYAQRIRRHCRQCPSPGPARTTRGICRRSSATMAVTDVRASART